ncbi:glycosyltransferase, group 2 family protein [Agrilactobacillus composti DSM 18527 = JCM 14202]|uniref:4,4'-diaponeurosporenoate glycosyltransferase n=1 Tax=Agrilactobacillus composti DSM 18527 = JCM 14202 TaxID=1423734 RepID=A0A0R1XKB2_9LACO|nr:glycosyltransferase, group 2 family protein [Agrilactobacillus composti DSM 18527 = JCM 14202]
MIIPTLNEAAGIGNLLKTVTRLAVGYASEIIVVDGGSQDKTVAIAQKYAKVYTLSQANRGAQLAYGVTKSQGDILWFLHGDSQLNGQQAIFADIMAVLSQPRVSAGCLTLRFTEKGFFYRYLAITSNWRAKYLGLIFGDQGLFTTRQNYQRAGGFLAEPLMEDWLLSRQLHRLGKFKLISAPIYTSNRRFAAHPWRTHLAMHRLQLLFILGTSPKDLAKRYNRRHN